MASIRKYTELNLARKNPMTPEVRSALSSWMKERVRNPSIANPFFPQKLSVEKVGIIAAKIEKYLSHPDNANVCFEIDRLSRDIRDGFGTALSELQKDGLNRTFGELEIKLANSESSACETFFALNKP